MHAALAVAIIDKIQSAYPALVESKELYCAAEILALRRKVTEKTATKRTADGRKIPIMVRLDLDMLERIDQEAKRLGLSRSALIASTMAHMLDTNTYLLVREWPEPIKRGRIEGNFDSKLSHTINFGDYFSEL